MDNVPNAPSANGAPPAVVEEEVINANTNESVGSLLVKYNGFRAENKASEAVVLGTLILNKLKAGELVQQSDFTALLPEQMTQMFAMWMANDASYLLNAVCDQAVNAHAGKTFPGDQKPRKAKVK